MSTPHVDSQSFDCQIPNCRVSYRRKEHLQRHMVAHLNPHAFPCSHCGRKFGRRDTLRRHMINRHKLTEPTSRAQRACSSCHVQKSRCQGGIPCDGCLSRKIQCSLSEPAEAGKDHSFVFHENSSQGVTLGPSGQHPSETKSQCLALYFEKFHPHWPIIHKESFNPRADSPLLVQTMVAIGMWMREEQSAKMAAIDIQLKLETAIRDQKDKWDGSRAEEPCSNAPWPVSTYQAILLHLIFSLIIQEPDRRGFNLQLLVSAADFELLEALVQGLRKRGMFYYPNILARYKELGFDPLVWACIEEVKRLVLALYKFCGRINISSSGLKSKQLIKASELQFPPPSNNTFWDTTGTKECLAELSRESLPDWENDYRENWISNYDDVLKLLES